MDYAELLKAFLMNQAAHTQGHMSMSYDMGMDPRLTGVNWRQGTESVPDWVISPRTDQQRQAATQWNGAGFTGQQKLRNQLMGSEIAPEYNIAQGLQKLGYLAGIKPSGTAGDIENMERISGNKMVTPLLGASALSDLYQAYNPDSRWNLEYITPQGAPGLQFNWKF